MSHGHLVLDRRVCVEPAQGGGRVCHSTLNIFDQRISFFTDGNMPRILQRRLQTVPDSFRPHSVFPEWYTVPSCVFGVRKEVHSPLYQRIRCQGLVCGRFICLPRVLQRGAALVFWCWWSCRFLPTWSCLVPGALYFFREEMLPPQDWHSKCWSFLYW